MYDFNPTLSIIIPAHNESLAIATTITSIQNNAINYPYEIIIACNGCNDDTADIARNYKVRVIESEEAGMSFGKNFGAAAATNDFLIFVDADTILLPGAIAKYLETIAQRCKNPEKIIGTVAGAPAKGGLVVKFCFLLANYFARCKKVHAPGGVMLMNKSIFTKINGFNESLPQGTSTDLIMRAIAAGAEYILLHNPRAITSIRRFEKKGIIRQMLDWRKNHAHMRKGEYSKVEKKDYKVIR